MQIENDDVENKLTEAILFEDERVLVIDKPVGVLAHGDGFSDEVTVAEWFLRRQPQAAGVGEPMTAQNGASIERSGVVHRLDKDTSGVLVLAKDQDTFEELKSQFQNRLAKKEYRAFVYGHMKERWGTIDRQIGRSARDFRLRSAQRGAKGTLREATTHWQLIQNGMYAGEQFAELSLRPETGRTHQLRVHLKALNRPIVGDTLYAGAELGKGNDIEIGRLALHAHTLTFSLSDEQHTFEAPLPASFTAAAAHLKAAQEAQGA